MKSIEQLQAELSQAIFAVGIQLEKLLEKQVVISVDASVNNYVALSALTCASGFFLGKIVTCLEATIKDCGDDTRKKVASLLNTISITALPFATPDAKSVRYDEDAKTIVLQYPDLLSIGTAALPSYVRMRVLLESVLGLGASRNRKIIETELLPKAQQKITSLIGSCPEIVIEWPQFEEGVDKEACLYNFAYYKGYYSVDNLTYGFDRAINYEKIPKDSIPKLVKKISIVNKPGRDYSNRFVIFNGETLIISCIMESWSGFPGSYDIARAMYIESKLNELERKFIAKVPSAGAEYYKGEYLSEDDEKKKVELLREIANGYAIQTGNYSVLANALKKKCFWQPDDQDRAAAEKFVATVPNGNKKENEEKEVLIHVWPITKINFRGQLQERLVLVTQKALYTICWNYQTNEPEKSRIHRFEYDTYYSLRFGPLKAYNDPAPKAESARWGLHFKSTLTTSKQEEFMQMAFSKALKSYTPKILKFLVNKDMASKGSALPKIKIENNKFPKLDYPIDLCRTTIINLMKDPSNSVPLIVVEGLPSQISLIDAINLILEQFELLSDSDQPQIIDALKENLPSLRVDDIVNSVCDLLDTIIAQHSEFDFTIPQELSIGTLFRLFTKSVKCLGSPPSFDFPEVKEISFAQLLTSLEEAYKRTGENQDKIDGKIKTLFGDQQIALPTVPKLVEAMRALGGNLPTIKFDKYPSLSLNEIMTASGDAIARISDLPTIKLLELKLPFLDLNKLPIPKLPNLNLNLPAVVRQLQPPPEPPFKEIIVEPFAEQSVKSHYFKIACQEMAWAIYGAAKANIAPHSVWSPWETGYVEVANSVFGMLYNKVGGKANKKK